MRIDALRRTGIHLAHLVENIIPSVHADLRRVHENRTILPPRQFVELLQRLGAPPIRRGESLRVLVDEISHPAILAPLCVENALLRCQTFTNSDKQEKGNMAAQTNIESRSVS